MDEHPRDTVPHNGPTFEEDQPPCAENEIEIRVEPQVELLDVVELDLSPAPIGDFGNDGRPSRPSREPVVDRTSLELKLNALIEEMRCELAVEQEAAAEVKGTAVHVAPFCAPTSHETRDHDAPKIVVRDGLDPRKELTVVGRRLTDNTDWLLHGMEEDAPTNPLLPPTIDVIEKEKPAPKRKRRALFVLAPVAMLGVLVIWLMMTHSTSSKPPTVVNQPPSEREFGTPITAQQGEPSLPPATESPPVATMNSPAMAKSETENGNTSRPRTPRSRKNKPTVVMQPPGRNLPKGPGDTAPEAPLEPKRVF